MNKKDIADILIKPGMVFIIIAAAAFAVFFKFHHDHTAADLIRDQQLSDRFAQDVQSGKQQLTTDRALAIILQERATVASYEKLVIAETWFLPFLGGVALFGIWLHISGLLRARKRGKVTDA